MTGRVRWQYNEEQLALVKTKQRRNQLYYALQLKYYETHLTFCSDIARLSHRTVQKVATLLSVKPQYCKAISAKTGASYRQEIRQFFASQMLALKHEGEIKQWLIDTVFPSETLTLSQLKQKTLVFLKEQKIEPPSDLSLGRIVKSAQHQYEQCVFTCIDQGLTAEAKAYLDGLLLTKHESSYFTWAKRWPGGLSLESILEEAEKLKFLKAIQLPDCFETIPNKQQHRYYRDICSKYPSVIKAMPDKHRHAFLAFFVYKRKQQLLDTLIDLLIRLIHKFVKAGENKLKKDLSKVTEIKKSCNAKQLLNSLITALLKHEDEVIKDAIYPIIPKETLEAAIKADENMNLYDTLVHERARRSFAHHYRRMLAPILELLQFNANNMHYNEMLEGIKLIQTHLDSNCQYYPDNVDVPIDKVIKSTHHHLVIENSKQDARVNRLSYEMCLLRNLRSKLRTKEIWIDGAYQYRNPDKDLPQDFDEQRKQYYNILNWPMDAKQFVKGLKRQLAKGLKHFNENICKNKHVTILKKPAGHIKISKKNAQPPPAYLEAIKQEVFNRWPNTSLLDVLKETDQYVNFIQQFVPSGSKEGLTPNDIKTRVLLAILGYGSNIGLKSVSVGNDHVSYQDLKYIKLRYLDPDNLRNAIRLVINQLLSVRSPKIWGACTTALASDSTLFQAWDQNLLSRWHPRYHKQGVMVYWHVDTKAICVYSQLKSCASSEVASMIEGVLRHCTDMPVKKNYVDTHGASEVGFAFSYILHFELLPRFNNIHNQKLFVVDKTDTKKYPYLATIISAPIKWQYIEAQYDQIIKYAAGLKLGTADAEIIMKRFTRDNCQHPVYKALCELGRVIKTLFLCRYLESETLRCEINEGLNVVERWNGINTFIFYGNSAIMRSQNPAQLQLSMLCLHLLQLSMVYINTLMLQQVIEESGWLAKMALEDKRAITPLLNEHINPY
ncbi:MAG: Tn3 family transposase, partial [Candidatus Marinimicrobia bacterium]|nr:Tn3 family transposase [Candidatus Neomarinimicrobiota bacterium]